MADNDNQGDEPTQAYQRYDDDATRLERPIPAYDPEREDPSLYAPSIPYTPAETKAERPWGLAAPLFTVALISIIIGIGIGYLLFHDSAGSKPSDSTTTTSTSSPVVVPSTTTTTARSSSSTTSTTAGTTSSTRRSTTTTTEATTSTTRRSTTSTSGLVTTSTTS